MLKCVSKEVADLSLMLKCVSTEVADLSLMLNYVSLEVADLSLMFKCVSIEVADLSLMLKCVSMSSSTTLRLPGGTTRLSWSRGCRLPNQKSKHVFVQDILVT